MSRSRSSVVPPPAPAGQSPRQRLARSAGWLAACLTLLPALVACGQKGPLFLPPPAAAASTAPASAPAR